MTNENFDYNTWREQGQNALNALQARKDTLVAELFDIDKQIKEVRKTIGSKKDAGKRFRIKPLIEQALAGKASLKVEALVAVIQKEKPGATEQQITAALSRYAHEYENVSITDGMIVIS
jgi:vacuolar-type H+-ATPase subunit D/Vma8